MIDSRYEKKDAFMAIERLLLDINPFMFDINPF